MNVNQDEDFLNLFFSDVNGYIEENSGIKYLVLLLQKKTKKH